MSMGIVAMMRVGVMALVGPLVTACANSDQATTSKSTVRSGAPWARDLNETPPRREPASQVVPRTKADLDAGAPQIWSRIGGK